MYTGYTQSVNRDDLANVSESSSFRMIDNYIYLYHTKKLLIIPVYPESIQDSMSTQFSPNTPLSRSAPIYSFSNSGPRSLQLTLPLHRDMMNDINVTSSRFLSIVPDLIREDYVDILINELQSAALPVYAASEKMVNPPVVAVKFGQNIFCKGVVNGGVSVTYSGPLLANTEKYAMAEVSFSINEVDPYDAEVVAIEGGYRGIRTTLERNLFTSPTSSGVSKNPKQIKISNGNYFQMM